MAKRKIIFTCEECGHQEGKWLGRCPSCGGWNSFREEQITPASGSGGGSAGGRGGRGEGRMPALEVPLDRVEGGDGSRFTSGIGELDRVLGGGIMRGSAVLIGGEPGIGKSTLMMHLASEASSGTKSLYISGEESASQVKMRADRLGAKSAVIDLLCESDLDRIMSVLRKNKPSMVIVDSIQSLISQEAGQVPGTVNQLKYGCHELIDWARESDAALFLVAHVTKEGSIAGPKVIEHMVDTVLYFDMADGGLRIVRAVKNRFGSVDELGLFTMEADGLNQVADPGEVFLVRRGGEMPPGIAAVPVYEGSRVLMVELQALTVPVKGGYSRVYSDRIDPGRVSRIAAVLERHLSLRFSDQDIYVNVAGGIRIGEVGIELPLAMALYSARTGIPIPKGISVAGELSLAGEIRPTGHMERRMKSAGELGFSRFVGPGSTGAGKKGSGYQQVGTIGEAVKAIFGGSGKGDGNHSR
jgi:DNA repair protein RadA/Sms